MMQDRLSYLILQAMADRATVEERVEMLEMMSDPARETQVKDQLLEAYSQPKINVELTREKKNQILDAVFQSDAFHKRNASRTAFKLNRGGFKWGMAAAIAVICISVGMYLNHRKAPELNTNVASLHQEVLPGGNNATLTLADGSVIALNDVSKGTIATQPGLVITKKADGQLTYEVQNDNGGNLGGSNTIATPLGGRYEVMLQDGTKVILNAGSRLTYPVSFKADKRQVTLTGEAYFEVAREKSRPFIVKTPAANGIKAQEIQVLGTHFNINAYADEEAYVTSLLEGSIKVAVEGAQDGRILKPGQRSVVTQHIRVADADIDGSVAWKDGIFYFADEPVQLMMRKLARWYNIEVVYQGAIPKVGFWAQISRSKRLSEVLEVLEGTNGVHFKVDGRRVTVMQ